MEAKGEKELREGKGREENVRREEKRRKWEGKKGKGG